MGQERSEKFRSCSPCQKAGIPPGAEARNKASSRKDERGLPRWNKINALAEKNLQEKRELYRNQKDFQDKKYLQKRKLEAWNKATSRSGKRPELQEEEEEEDKELDEEDRLGTKPVAAKTPKRLEGEEA